MTKTHFQIYPTTFHLTQTSCHPFNIKILPLKSILIKRILTFADKIKLNSERFLVPIKLNQTLSIIQEHQITLNCNFKVPNFFINYNTMNKHTHTETQSRLQKRTADSCNIKHEHTTIRFKTDLNMTAMIQQGSNTSTWLAHSKKKTVQSAS